MRFGILANGTVTLGPDEAGQTITVRRPSQKDKDSLADLLGTVKIDGKGAQGEGQGQEMRMLIGSMRRFRREVSVTGWTLLDAAGNPLPFSKAAMDTLDDETRDFIDTEVAKLWDGSALTVDEKNA